MSFMAVILQSLPQEAGLTKIEYEGPRIALYTRNPSYLVQNHQLVSNIVNAIKKRIVVRTDESIRSSEKECASIISKSLSSEVGLVETFFDSVTGEAIAFVKKPWLVAQAGDDYDSIELLEKTGWRVKIKRAPVDTSVLRTVYDLLTAHAPERMRFYRDVGEKIFRERLTNEAEASVVALGGFAEVGRSCILLLTSESKILLDCGINTAAHDSLSALPRFDVSGLLMEQIDGVVLTHAHMDHAGFLPALFKYGYRGPVYCTDPTLGLMYLLQHDYVERKGSNALYSATDIAEEVIRTITLTYGTVTDISPDVRLVLSNTGHIIGSSSVHLHIGNGDHNLVYTGDLKFGKTIALENASWNFARVETLIIESTYGGRDDVFEPRERAEALFAQFINSVAGAGGNILVPAPVAGVSQELVLLLDSLIQSGKVSPQVDVVVDGLIAKASSLYEAFPEYLDRDLRSRILRSESTQFGFSDNFVRSDTVVSLKKPTVVISSSAFLSGSNSLEYLRQIAGDPKNMLLFVSYQPLDTLGRAILEGRAKSLSFPQESSEHAGQQVELRCRIERLHGLDSHSDYNQLMAYVARLRPKLRRVLVNHGEKPKAQNLASSISKSLKIQTQHPLVQEAVKLL
ncbi:MAG: beta-CASP ribonuclease aCPSF1 [Nitrososphaera sp.]